MRLLRSRAGASSLATMVCTSRKEVSAAGAPSRCNRDETPSTDPRGEGACSRWAAKRPQSQPSGSNWINRFAGFAPAAQSSGSKLPRHHGVYIQKRGISCRCRQFVAMVAGDETPNTAPLWRGSLLPLGCAAAPFLRLLRSRAGASSLATGGGVGCFICVAAATAITRSS